MDVGRWLESLGMGAYAEAFAANGVDAALLRELSNDDLKDLGVDRLADRKRLLKAIGELPRDGSGAAAAPATAALPEGDRRQVTVLFADLSGFTRLSGRLGAEATHELLNRYFHIVDGIVERSGGTIDKHIGDNVMALFGAPVAHADDPERAVGAALDIHLAMAGLGAELGYDLTAHVGIATGQVVASGTGSSAFREYTVTGDAVNLAARLQDKAGAAETLISDGLKRIVAGRFECDALGEIEMKGIAAPVRVWRVTARKARDTAIGQTALVGRQAELASFGDILDACRAGSGQAILVRAEAGMGKSRLIEEFATVAANRGCAVHRTLVLDFGAGEGQDPLRSVVRSLLGLAPAAAGPARLRAAAAAAADGAVTPDQRAFLCELLDLPIPEEDRPIFAAMDRAMRHDGVRAVTASLLRRACTDRPAMIVVEDLHWADRPSLAHLAGMAAAVARCRALLVLTTRVEGDPVDDGWRAAAGGCPMTTIDLAPLRVEDAIAFAASFIGADDPLLLHCVARAEGNPLFLEQLVRGIEESRGADVPGTIQSIVLARTDRLPPADRRALQAASVLGQRFAVEALRHLLDDRRYACEALVGHALLRPAGDSYLFAHALIREAIYASMLSAQARELHRRTAGWFAERDPLLHAEHLDRAGDPGAAAACLRAAELEAGRYNYETALRLVERGLRAAADPAGRFALSVMQGQLLNDLGDMPGSLQACAAALDAAPDAPARCQALLGLAAAKRVTDDLEGALADLRQAEEIAVAIPLTAERARIHTMRGNLMFPRGDIEACLREHGLGLQLAREAGSAALEAAALGGLGDAEYARGRMRSAHRELVGCVEVSRAHGLGRVEVANLAQVAHAMLYLGPQDAALDTALEAVRMAERVGHRRAELNARAAAIFALFALDERDRCREQIELARAVAQRLGAARFEQPCRQYLGGLELADGRRAAAVETLRAAAEVAQRTGPAFHGPQIYGLLARALDEPGEKRRALAEGEAIIRRGCVGHNELRFYPDAMAVARSLGDHAEAERHAAALEAFTRPEPLAWSDLHLACGRALAAFARGDRGEAGPAGLHRLRAEAGRLGVRALLPDLDSALAAG
ncbi:MAG: adenylate/guanylate cyclase domain-containing protein [Dongiaceae bacterium]